MDCIIKMGNGNNRHFDKVKKQDVSYILSLPSLGPWEQILIGKIWSLENIRKIESILCPSTIIKGAIQGKKTETIIYYVEKGYQLSPYLKKHALQRNLAHLF